VKEMQKRHKDRQQYFNELANTSREYYINYLSNFVSIKNQKVLEIGCGEGGNLLPFAEIGCEVTGIDISVERIAQANSFFQSFNMDAKFYAIDFFEMKCADETEKFDIILVHDVIEHIEQKDRFFNHIKQFLARNGVIFWGFPAWQMPFGGHQQICHNKICSVLPFIHLFPKSVYRYILSIFNEPKSCMDELIYIKKCGISIEKFEKLMKKNEHTLIDRCLWLINPHYKQKFGLKPRKLYALSQMKYIRNFFATSCFYVTGVKKIF
jgi:ubiquinone/menaquinone biosynthesis C-methylase UbiE